MPPVDINSISITRKSPASATSKKAPVLTSHGRITSVGESYDGKHANVNVQHGRKKKVGGGKGAGAVPVYHEQPDSRFAVSKRHAHHFPVGKRVKMTMSPVESTDGDGDEASE